METQAKKSSIYKRRRNIILAVGIPIGIVVALDVLFLIVMISIYPKEYKWESAGNLIKRKLDIDRVIWFDHGFGRHDSNIDTDFNTSRGCNIIVGYKDGEEIAAIFPHCPRKGDKPKQIDWMFDISFTEMTERMTAAGVSYIIDRTKDIYSLEVSDGYALRIVDNNYSINEKARLCGLDGEELLQRLDVGAVFSYNYKDNETSYKCLITQENHEFKVYRYNEQTEELDILTI